MKLPAQRVRHLDNNNTTKSMQEYLKNTYLFDSLMDDNEAPVGREKPVCSGLRSPLTCEMGSDFASPTVQQSFLHPELRVARFELLDLLCNHFHLPKSPASYVLLENFEFRFGQQLCRRDGQIYWATDSQYFRTLGDTPRRRRDILCVDGFETVRKRKADGSYTEIKNALCCQAVCFLVLHGVSTFLHNGGSLPPAVFQRVCEDTLTFIIGRWFEPHPSAVERDSKFRPVCPGQLYINQCLWRCAITPRHRRALFRRDGGTKTTAVNRQLATFGQTAVAQEQCLLNEKYAYFCLISPDNVTGTASMCPLFFSGTCTPDRNTWLQTVTLI